MPNSCSHELVDEVDASERELGQARGAGVLVRRVEGGRLCGCRRIVTERMARPSETAGATSMV